MLSTNHKTKSTCMEQVLDSVVTKGVPLCAEAKVGKNWEELETLEIEHSA